VETRSWWLAAQIKAGVFMDVLILGFLIGLAFQELS
jgi:hypothetical protein